MADSDNGNKIIKPGTNQVNMETRLMLTFVLMGVILLVSQYLYKPPIAPKPVKAVESAKVSEAKPVPAQPTAAPAATPAEPVAQVSAQKEESFVVDTKLYRVVFSNLGAMVRSWELKEYKDEAGHPVDVVNKLAAAKVGYPFALSFKGTKPSADVNHALFAAKPSPDGLGIEYDYSNGKTVVHKSFRFQKDSYLSQVRSGVFENGNPVPHLMEWRGGFGDATVANAPAAQHSLHYDLSNNKLVVNDAKSAKDGPVIDDGQLLVRRGGGHVFCRRLSSEGRQDIRHHDDQRFIFPRPAIPTRRKTGWAPRCGEGDNQFSLFVGPKDLDLLKQVAPRLQSIVDFGWLSVIAKPLFLALNWVNDMWVHNYGWSIVVVTIIINMALLPVRFTSMKSMKRMSALQPEIAKINREIRKHRNAGSAEGRTEPGNDGSV